jgi:hypothetical protein
MFADLTQLEANLDLNQKYSEEFKKYEFRHWNSIKYFKNIFLFFRTSH